MFPFDDGRLPICKIVYKKEEIEDDVLGILKNIQACRNIRRGLSQSFKSEAIGIDAPFQVRMHIPKIPVEYLDVLLGHFRVIGLDVT